VSVAPSTSEGDTIASGKVLFTARCSLLNASLPILETGEGSLPAPPFYWGLNGIMSVIGSVTTVFVALIWGFQAAMLMGSACYVLAALASVKAFPNQLAVSGEQ